jgi:hypothetical protein
MDAVAHMEKRRKAALLVALIWSAALPVTGLTAPVYNTEMESPSGTVARGTDTLVGVNGSGVLAALTVPLMVSIVVAALLILRFPGALVIAWTMTAALGALTALAMLSIGIYLLPVAVALVVACAAEPAPAKVA